MGELEILLSKRHEGLLEIDRQEKGGRCMSIDISFRKGTNCIAWVDASAVLF